MYSALYMQKDWQAAAITLHVAGVKKQCWPLFCGLPRGWVCVTENNPFGVQLESETTISIFLSRNEDSLLQSRHGGPETAELLNPCVSAVVVGRTQNETSGSRTILGHRSCSLKVFQQAPLYLLPTGIITIAPLLSHSRQIWGLKSAGKYFTKVPKKTMIDAVHFSLPSKWTFMHYIVSWKQRWFVPMKTSSL